MVSDFDADGDAGVVGTEVEPMVAVYRHDVHKLRGRRHSAGSDEYHGVRVNEAVPLGADGDAALLSRPAGEPERTVANHVSPYRVSLVTGETAVTTDRIEAAVGGGFADLVTPEDPAELHAAWVTSDVPAAFNESVYYPFTSLKFHVLLTGALLSAYLDGHAFDDLYMVVSPGESVAAGDVSVSAALEAAAVTPFETVVWSPVVTVDVTADPGGRPAAWLGEWPARSFADAWSRLPKHPLCVDGERLGMVLDAQLRRIRSWSVALQYIEDFGAWVAQQDRAGSTLGSGRWS